MTLLGLTTPVIGLALMLVMARVERWVSTSSPPRVPVDDVAGAGAARAVPRVPRAGAVAGAGRVPGDHPPYPGRPRRAR
jgi:hypothetical protein